MGSIYLPQNLDILAYSAGYTTYNFLKKIRMSPSTYLAARKYEEPFSHRQENKVYRFLGESELDWLLFIFNKCYYQKKLKRFEVCLFDEPFDESEATFRSNIHALRYFFNMDRSIISRLTYVSDSGITRIESGKRKKVYEEEHLLIDQALREKASELGAAAFDVYNNAHFKKILNKIPKYAHCVPRKKYTSYNEETQTIF